MTLYSLVPKSLQKIITPTFFRYGIMAVIVVGIELFSFWVLNTPLKINYLVATILSLLLGILLNWIGSRYYVFGQSRHTAKKEFLLVLTSSLAGAALQSAVVYTTVEILHGQPIVGKLFAILITFFWNYIIRKRYIYNKNPIANKDIEINYRKIAVNTAIYLALVAAVFAFFVWRHPNNIIASNFYGEDGSVYLQNIVTRGWLRSSIRPFNGYSIVGLYALCGLGWFINLFLGGTIFTMSAAFAVAAILFMAAVICLPFLLFRKRFGTFKIFLVIVFSALMPLPVTPHVVIGTIGNQKWVFLYFAFLLMVYRATNYKKLSIFKYVIVDIFILVCAYTNSAVYLLMPIPVLPYLFDYIKDRKRLKIIPYIKSLLKFTSIQSFLLLIILLIPQLLYVVVRGIPELPGYLDTPFEHPKAIEVFINRTYIFGVTHYINSHMGDVAAFLLFGFLIYYGWRKLRGDARLVFFAGIYSAGMTSLLFAINRPGITHFFYHYSSGGSGPDQFYYTQTLIMYLPIVLLGAAMLKELRNKILRTAFKSSLILFVIFSGFLSISRYGGFWKNASEFENDAGTFTDQALVACKTSLEDPVRVIVYPYKAGDFAIKLPRKEVCDKKLTTYQPSFENLGLQVNNNDHLPLLEQEEFTQTFTADSNGLDGVKIFLSTFGINFRKGDYSFTLYDSTCKIKIRQTVIPKELKDGNYYNIRFVPINKSRTKMYCFSISPPAGKPFNKIAIQKSAPDIYPIGTYTEHGVAKDVDVVFEPLYTANVPR